jgi:hypothetical protein
MENYKENEEFVDNFEETQFAELSATKKDDNVNITQIIKDVFNNIFNKSTIVLIIWFLAIYFISYFILGFFFKSGTDNSNFQFRLSRTLDIIVLFFLLIFVITTYFAVSESNKENILSNVASGISDFYNQPSSIFSVLGFIIIFYLIIYLFRIPMAPDSKSLFVRFIENVAWFSLLIIVIIDFFKYGIGFSPIAMASNSLNWSSLPKAAPIDKPITGKIYVGDTKPKGNINGNINGNVVLPKNEVFNISNNLYTYDDAQAICTSYGAKLATYDQIEQEYNKGAEWCNYGWSDGQMAFFPTQKDTWDKLQKTKNNKNNCGRPGVNGGYFDNPNIKFGVNCFGKKPKPNSNDLASMMANQNKEEIQPKTAEQVQLDKKVKFWKENSDKLLKVNSYNNYKWSAF